MNQFHKRVRQRREALGLTQDQLAKRLGYKSRSSINKIEVGENDVPRSKLEDFAAALETSVPFLLGQDEESIGKNVKVFDEEDRPVVLDDETLAIIDSLRSRPDMKMLFSVSRKAKPEDIIKTVKIIEALRDESGRN